MRLAATTAPAAGMAHREVTDAVHAEGAKLSGQIGHAGAVGASAGLPGLSPSRFFSPVALRRTREMQPDDFDRIPAAFAETAVRLQDNGFDAIELHYGFFIHVCSPFCDTSCQHFDFL